MTPSYASPETWPTGASPAGEAQALAPGRAVLAAQSALPIMNDADHPSRRGRRLGSNLRRHPPLPGHLVKLAFLALVLPLVSMAPAPALPHVFDQPAFQQCEAEAFLALVVARNAMHLGNSKETQLAVRSNGEFAIATIEEVYSEMRRSGTRDHGSFAARKFYRCAQRSGLPLREDIAAAGVCLARQDIVFFVNVDRQRGRPPAEAGARAKDLMSKSSASVYPEALVDQLVPMVYRVASDDDEYELRQFVFETCLLPEAWKAWFEASQKGR